MKKIETFRDRLKRVMDRHAAEVAAGHVHRDATVPAVAPASEPADVAALHDEIDRLRALLAEVLGHFNEKGHPGESCLRTGWLPERWLARWQLAARGLPVDTLRRGGLAVLDDGPHTRAGRFWTCPDHPAADVRQSGNVACCMEPGCGYGPPESGSDGAR